MEEWVHAVRRARAVLRDDVAAMPARHPHVRPAVYASWRRARLLGLHPDGLRPRPAGARDDRRICAAAATVVGRHLAVLDLVPCALTLTDACGVVLRTWARSPAIEQRLDDLRIGPGHGLAESALGTTAAVALRGEPVLVRGPEHFAQEFAELGADLAGAGAPIVHPRTGTTAGSVVLTCRLTDAGPFAVATAGALAIEVARAIRPLDEPCTVPPVRSPGKLSELDAVVSRVLAQRPAGSITDSEPSAELLARTTRLGLGGLERTEAVAIVAALRDAGGNKLRAARTLGIARSTLYRKVRALGLDLATTAT